ncbi:MAG TPA: hypothetical protein VGH05_10900 [Buttiauxella sp.]|jgi:hypothetical protein
MRKTALAEGLMIAVILGSVLLTVSSVSLLLLTHLGTMVFW